MQFTGTADFMLFLLLFPNVHKAFSRKHCQLSKNAVKNEDLIWQPQTKIAIFMHTVEMSPQMGEEVQQGVGLARKQEFQFVKVI